MEPTCRTSCGLSDLVDDLCRKNAYCSRKLKGLLVGKEWSKPQRRTVLQTLMRLFLQPRCTEDVTVCLGPLVLDIVERAKTQCAGSANGVAHQKFCVALIRAASTCLDLKSFLTGYLKSSPSFLCINMEKTDEEPRKKRAKKEESFTLELILAAFQSITLLETRAKEMISLEQLLNFLSFDNKDVQWFAAQTISRILQMSSHQKNLLINKHFTSKEQIDLLLRHRSFLLLSRQKSEKFTTGTLDRCLAPSVNKDLGPGVTSIEGVLLSKIHIQETQQLEPSILVPVGSTVSNLRRLAVAISASKPILLQGPVGCGKTSLVEHIAYRTGRVRSPHLLKIQLGDQTDSKALLGVYQCTDVAGEFVWQPGVLTRAITDGYWVLLEDIDQAPMDVISILLPLLENNSLPLPGRGDSIRAAPTFQLFATQRLHGTLHLQHSNNSIVLDKLWTKIVIDPLSRSELHEVITTKHPQLLTVGEKLLDIYHMMSAGKHLADNAECEVPVHSFQDHGGRLISTRDLINWCNRIAAAFDSSSKASEVTVFQDALDCFCACIPNAMKQIDVAEAIGSKLNIPKTKAEYYCTKYKPPVEVSPTLFTIGRVKLQRKMKELATIKSPKDAFLFSFNRHSSALLEKVAACVANDEPVLLVGETGTGKTCVVQMVAKQLGYNLKVINMNQQSDGSDLLGGFKPIDLKLVVKPFQEDFEILFTKTFSRKQNNKFLNHLQVCFNKRHWKNLFSLMEHILKTALDKHHDGDQYWQWQALGEKLQQLKLQVQRTESALAFAFVEGTLVKALKNGDWVLLDEINLATMETLECLSGLLESKSGSVLLTERGDTEPIVRQGSFRLFACMNPATDVGKKDLTSSLRNRFTEIFVNELEEEQDLKVLVSDYLRGLSLTSPCIDGIIKFYTCVREAAAKQLTDGSGHRPVYSLRTLCRALRCAAKNPGGGVFRSLYESFCMSFLTQLDRSSYPVVEGLVRRHIVGKVNKKTFLSRSLPKPAGGKHLEFEGYWIPVGDKDPFIPESYILTASVRTNLRDLARIISIGQNPVLIQGETSVGKTSLIMWLAEASGNQCVRVNNHEHTDLQEYVGCYAADETGKLVFKEGVLVEAMRKGFWIILDELNLAPTDVLEALNRLNSGFWRPHILGVSTSESWCDFKLLRRQVAQLLLDDNRELFIPETQLLVEAHRRFRLFATQNPPGHYGGRKVLSRAFRNRFVELHFNEIPSKELEVILSRRCDLPSSYSRKLVAVMLELQTRRKGSGVFAGKQGFMTLRDLFRWAERYRSFSSRFSESFYDWEQHLADHGFMLLAGRVRKSEEEVVVQDVLQKHFKRTVLPDTLFDVSPDLSPTTADLLKEITSQSPAGFEHIVWTRITRRLAVLIGQAIKYKEPVLLVGETGCGKTTVCQLYAALFESKLYSINCHMHTEGADFLGGLRPVRTHEEMDDSQKLFEWNDGPLVKAMREGNMFLIDEISLADDSVLERLNSVLESERTLLLVEKGGGDDGGGGGKDEVEQIVAEDAFRIFATMNPGGDFGKKELSPALRNRFTEIWCPQIASRHDMVAIIEHNLEPGICLGGQGPVSGFGVAIMDFLQWFANSDLGRRCTLSIRDVMSWVQFINKCCGSAGVEKTNSHLDPAMAYIHGACLVFLDGLGAGSTCRGSSFDVGHARNACVQYLLEQVNRATQKSYSTASLFMSDTGTGEQRLAYVAGGELCVPPFSIPQGCLKTDVDDRYALNAPTTCVNAQRVLRALQLPRPLLLEGSPGVGKTSLVAAVARAAKRELVRINLSEQTDVTDLFGADLPVEGGPGGVFEWRDGPMLRALKAGHWVILDELNLASQSVLEGLNACFDHRAEIFIPELGKTFHIQHEKTCVFACQNPVNQGGGRKGLPRSFLNRFTQVYIESLSVDDMMFIGKSLYPDIPEYFLSKMVEFNMEIYYETMIICKWGQKGGPWEFNLRDLFRWCDLLVTNQVPKGSFNPGEYVSLIYKDRMRTAADKEKVVELYRRVFPDAYPAYQPSQLFQLTTNWLQVGPEGCGKTSLVQVLAELTAHKLQIIPMNSAMDTTEMLGGFEQANIGLHIDEVAGEVESIIDELEKNLLLSDLPTETIITLLHNHWKRCTSCRQSGQRMSSLKELQLMKKHVEELLLALEMVPNICEQFSIKVHGDLISCLKEKLMALARELSQTGCVISSGSFEWVDSSLVRALRSGNWLLIDNVNFCCASVLDRLNGLLEPNGVLSISECGVIDGKVKTIQPHPNFRLFLAMDPKYGEVSRAMRNRGIEIHILGEANNSWTDDSPKDATIKETNMATNLDFSVIPPVREYCEHADLARVQHHLGMLASISDTGKAPLDLSVACSLHLAVDFASAQNWELCSGFAADLDAASGEKPLPAQQKTWLPLVATVLKSVFDSPVKELYNALLHQLVRGQNQEIELVTCGPYDVRWNKQAWDRLVSPQHSLDTTELIHIINRLRLCQHVSVAQEVNQPQLRQLELLCNKGSEKDAGAHRILVHLFNFLVMLGQELIQLSLKLEDLPDKQFYRIANSLKWIRRLLLTAVESENWKKRPEERLTLFWSWLYKKLLKPLTSTPNWMSQKFQSLVKQTHNLLGEEGESEKFYRRFLEAWGHPTPFQSPEQAIQRLEVENVIHAMNILKEHRSQQLMILVKDAIKLDRVALTSRFINVLLLIASSEKQDEIKAAVVALHKEVADVGTKRSVLPSVADDGHYEGDRVPRLEASVKLWSLLDHFVLLVERQNVGYLLSGEVEELSCRLQPMMNFMLQRVPVSPLLLWEYSNLAANLDVTGSKKQDVLKFCHSTILVNHYTHLRQNCAGADITKMLQQPSLNSGSVGILKSQTLTTATASGLLHKLLSTASSVKSRVYFSNPFLVEMPVGEHLDELSMLDNVRNHLWVNSASLATPQLCPMAIERVHIIQTLCHMMTSLQAALRCVPEDRLTRVVQKLDAELGTSSSCISASLLEEFFSVFSSFADSTIVSHCMLKALKDGLENVSTLCSSPKPSSLMATGSCWVTFGTFQSALLAPKGLTDPIERDAIKLSHVNEELQQIETELQFRNAYWLKMTAVLLDDVQDELLHPHLKWLRGAKENLEAKKTELEARSAFRPITSQFMMLVRDVQDFLSTAGSTGRILGMLEKAKGQYKKISEGKMKTAAASFLQEIEVWHRSAEQFIERMDTTYPIYRDLVFPFTATLHQMCHGFDLVAQSLRMSADRQSLAKQCAVVILKESQFTWLEEIYCSLTKFPTCSSSYPSILHLTRVLISDLMLQFVQTTCTDSNDKQNLVAKELTSRVILSGLDHVKNYALISGELSPELLKIFGRILDLLVTAWQCCEEDRRRKEEEEASLYRIKTKIHGSQGTEEERDESEFRQEFPTFEQDFADMGFCNDMTQPNSSSCKDQDNDNDNEDTLSMSLRMAEMAEVSRIHQLLFTSLSRSCWLKQLPVEASINWIKPALTTYKVASNLSPYLHGKLYYGADSEVMGGHLLATAATEKLIQGDADTDQALVMSRGFSEAYNIYQDSNVSEVTGCLKVLKPVLNRINELKVEWPEHPILKELASVVERILSFSLTEPVMKFLSGLELLLLKAQDWESIAAKRVSLATQLSEISHLVIQWRKLELGCWSSSLDVVAFKMEKEASKWWFHLYQIISSFLNSKPLTEVDAKAVTDKDVLVALKQFMEDSSLGEFRARLGMIYAFHCQLVYTEVSRDQDILSRMLWNVYHFYCQFIPAVETEVAKQRAPIEKKLKAFVKIARWKDINYWALRQVTEKTHRTVHKYTKQFMSVLNEPMKTVLKNDKVSLVPAERTEDDDRMPNVDESPPAAAVLNQDLFPLALPAAMLDDFPQLHRVPRLLSRVSRHWETLQQNLPYQQLLDTLDEFTGTIIETVHEFQSLAVTPDATKEKQRAEAKHIHLRKRRALAELFKSLRVLGLSYRKGLAQAVDSMDIALRAQPVDMSAAMEYIFGNSQHHSAFADIWDGCHKYYYRCMLRCSQLNSVAHSPAQDLGLPNLSRCKGFGEHIMHVLVGQQQTVAMVIGEYCTFRKLLSDLKSLQHRRSETLLQLPPQSGFRHWLMELKNLLVEMYEGLEQFRVLLHCCPRVDAGLAQTVSPLPDQVLPAAAFMKLQDDTWQTCNAQTNMVIDSVKKIQKSICAIKDKSTFSWNDLEIVYSSFTELREVTQNMRSVETLFLDPMHHSSSCFSEGLTFLREKIQDRAQAFFSWHSTIPRVTIIDDSEQLSVGASANYLQQADELITSVLLSVQNLLETHLFETSMDSAEPADDIKRDHLVKLIHQSLSKDLKAIDCHKVVHSLQNLLENLVSLWDNASGRRQELAACSAMTQCLLYCLPLLDHYSQILEKFMLYTLISLRATGKLCSVLISIFTELISKGFCIPPEFSDEVAKGAKEFEDMEGGGIGEGEGVKDVSDQIENEDQLLETHKEGEEKREEDFSQQPDIKSEDNAIEMSEQFDGKLQDAEFETDDEEGSDDDKEEEELDKEMGDVDSMDTEKLNQQLWGSDDEDSDKCEKEEDGPGAGQVGETELVAKEENRGKAGENKDDSNKDSDQPENEEEKKIKDFEQPDLTEYDGEKVDPYHGNQEMETGPENLDLPEDLNLDDDEKDADKDEDNVENAMDIDKMATEKEVEDDSPDDEKNEDGIEEEKEMDAEDGQSLDPGMDAEDEQSQDPATEDVQSDFEKDAQSQDAAAEVEQAQDTAAEDASKDLPGDDAHLYGHASNADNPEQSDLARDLGGQSENNQEETSGHGIATTETAEGHRNEKSRDVAKGFTLEGKHKQEKRKPGISDSDRSIGSTEEKYRHLKMLDGIEQTKEGGQEPLERPEDEADLYQHVSESSSHCDAQTVDTATTDQQQAVPEREEEKKDAERVDEQEDVQPLNADEIPKDTTVKEMKIAKGKESDEMNAEAASNKDEEMETNDSSPVEIAGERISTSGVQRGPNSTFHTSFEQFDREQVDLDMLRLHLEGRLLYWTDPQLLPEQEQEAVEMWQWYDTLTCSLAQELCEQLRLILEPSQAARLRGDYRTGKRLNMRKIIPYIASEFRKDKIWLRRTKPSKRQYQIMLAIDNSSSMVDNHSKQLAFESLAVIANALTLLEAGELAICSFGETVQMVHCFGEQFSSQTGARLLQHFTFTQTKTKIAQLLHQSTATMMEARSRQHGFSGHKELSQLLVIVSDGRGLFMEGMEVVDSAVRQARNANIFLVFVVLDNPNNKDSILDIRVPVFKGPGQIPEIKSYMDHFPFPYYIILRDANSLPETLSDALRQWFELVTAGDG